MISTLSHVNHEDAVHRVTRADPALSLRRIDHGRWQPPDRGISGNEKESVVGAVKKAKHKAKAARSKAKKGAGKVKHGGKKVKRAAKR
jgi:hypothetical protein